MGLAGIFPAARHPQKQSILMYAPVGVLAYNQPVFILPGRVEKTSPCTFVSRGPRSGTCFQLAPPSSVRATPLPRIQANTVSRRNECIASAVMSRLGRPVLIACQVFPLSFERITPTPGPLA